MTKGYKMCGYQTKVRGYRNAQVEIQVHFENEHQIDDLFGKNLVIGIESKPAKKWKCPNCGQEMSYGDKYFHNQNRKKFCIKS